MATGADRARRALSALFGRDVGAQYAFDDGRGGGGSLCVGLAVRRPATVVSERTTFHCFSSTKPITALAILQLAEAGALRIDDRLRAHLPELPYRNEATICDALCHQAGLANPLPLSWVHRDEDHPRFDSDAFFRRVIAENQSARPAAQRASYSNIGYLVLGRIVQKCSGMSYESYVERHVLDRVRPQDDDAYLGFSIPADRHAVGYTRLLSALGLLVTVLPDRAKLQRREGGWVRYRPFHLDGTAYGGLKGNALGWSALLSALARRDERLLTAASYDAFYTPRPRGDGQLTGFALSWMTGRLRDVSYVCHPGGGPGFMAEIRVYPSRGAWSVLLANTTIVHDARLLDRLDTTWLHV